MARKDFEDWQDFLEYVLRGDKHAISFCLDLFDVSQIWDDIIDDDNPNLIVEDAYRSFWKALVDIPRNPFYQANFGELQPLIQAALSDWMDANELQRGSLNEKAAAFTLRDTLTRIVITCARIVGGYEWMRVVSLKVSKTLYDESFDLFLEELDGKWISPGNQGD